MTNSTSQQIQAFIHDETTSHQVVVFSKSWCPYCKATKTLLHSSLPSNVDLVVHELDLHPHGELIQTELAKLTGQRTVPNVFVAGEHLGGNSDVHQAHANGKLAQALVKIQA